MSAHGNHADAGRIPGSMCLTKATLAINASSAATVKTTGATTISVGGVMKSFSALSAAALTAMSDSDVTGFVQPRGAAGFYTQPVSTTAYYVLAHNGTSLRVIQGTYAGQPMQPYGIGAVGNGKVPKCPDGWVPFGIIKVVTDGSTTFAPGTTALDASGLTVTFFDIAVNPAGRAI